MRPVPQKAGFRYPLAFASRVRTFRQGLGETGYAEDRNVAIEFRWAESQHSRLSALVADPEDIARFWSALAITECDRRANRRHGRGGCIPRIAKVVNPVDIARVGAGVHASRCGQAGLPTIAD
jgi:hypothetical protein